MCNIRCESIENDFVWRKNFLQRLLDLNQLEDTIVHLLDGFELCETHASLVWDIINATFSFGVLTASSTHLQIVFASGFLELSKVGSEFGELNVHGGADGCSLEDYSLVIIEFTMAINSTLTRLVGQNVRKPRRSWWEKGMSFSMLLTAVTKRV